MLVGEMRDAETARIAVEASLTGHLVMSSLHTNGTLEAIARMRRALDELPEIYRTVLVLRHYEDLKFREIAEVLGVPEGTVKSRMTEALSQFGRLLKTRSGYIPKMNLNTKDHLKESLML